MEDRHVVGLIGHSYIRRLGKFMEQNAQFSNLCLDQSKFRVVIRSRGGLTIRGLANSRHLCVFPSVPDVCYVQIGGNYATRLDAHTIARDIVSFANCFLHGHGVKYVIIGQLLRRNPDDSPPGYNDEVVKINRILQSMTSSITGIKFWKHRGFWSDLAYLGHDGVHLDVRQRSGSPSPMVKYLQSIQYAVNNSLRQLRPV